MGKTYGKSDKVIDAEVGEEFSIALDSVPTAGYEWQAALDRESAELVDKRFDEPGGIGGSGKEVFTFKPVSKGESVIRLQYKRPWEDKSEETVEIKVRVKS